MSLTLQLGIRHITVAKLQAGSEFVTIFGKILYNANIENVFKGIEEGSTINEDDYIRLIDNVSENFAHFLLNFKNRNF
ncbi:MAG: hypothetical protein HEQ33_15220 [Dolichospermum sp. WA123]|nr:hypothetical protein [Dolichospermum sp. WA123]